MQTFELFTAAGWDHNKHMPPYDPGSLADDVRVLLDAWQKGPDNVEGAEWVIPPARGKDRQVVGDDYRYKAGFNKPGLKSKTFMVGGGFIRGPHVAAYEKAAKKREKASDKE